MKLFVVAGFSLSLISCAHRTPVLEVYSDVPPFHLIAQNGQAFDSQALRGKIWVADFIYTTCPGPCPRMTSQMREVQDAVKNFGDVRLVSFTVDPANDTPPVLSEYGKVHGALFDMWWFLTGSSEELNRLDRDVFKLGNLNAQMEHSTRFVLVDRQSRIRAYYDTSEATSIPKLIDDIKTLDRESV